MLVVANRGTLNNIITYNSGNVGSMMSVCSSWEDRLWAHYKALVCKDVEYVSECNEATTPMDMYECTH